MNRQSLTLDDVPDALLAEFGLQRSGATAVSYCFDDASAVLVPLLDISVVGQRKLNPERLRDLLRGICDGSSIPAVAVYRVWGDNRLRLHHGMHRLRVSQAVGFTSIPAVVMSEHEAESLGLI